VRRILALGNLLPRIRTLYRGGEIDPNTVRHLTLASKSQQNAWLALRDDDNAWCPTGHQLKAWLFGGTATKTAHALFDVDASGIAVIADLFGEEPLFADSDAFWTAQMAEVEARKAAYIEAGWSDVILLERGARFRQWDYSHTTKRKGGRVYVAVNHRGEVTFHEGYLTAKEARRLRKAEVEGADAAAPTVPARPELTSALNAYVDLHRHAAVRAELAMRPAIALRVMVAHAICGSRGWSVRTAETGNRNAAIAESVETCAAETAFDARRRAILAVLGFDGEDATVVRGYGSDLVPVLTCLLALPDEAVMEVLGVVMAETLDVGGDVIEVIGPTLGIDMADRWQADEAFFGCLRDREVLTALLAEVGGAALASANAKEKGSVIKGLIADHLAGANDRPKVERWVPKWMMFPPAAYTARGGVGSVAAAQRAQWLAERDAPANADAGSPEVGEPAPGEVDPPSEGAAPDDGERMAA
jgi:ParB family chromosome partitioning protein